MEFIHEITIIKVEMKKSTKGKNEGNLYQLVTILTEWGVANIVNRGDLIVMTSQVLVTNALLKVSLGKFTSVELLSIEN